MDILISGASMAGLSLARSLTGFGARVTLIERSTSLRQGGSAIDVRGAALAVAADLGILDEIRAARVAFESGGTFLAADGSVAAVMNVDRFYEDPGDVEITRDDLNRILFDGLPRDVDLRFGTSVAALEDGRDDIRATFKDGRTERFDLVVGADGLHSTTRRLTFDVEARFVHHLGVYVALIDLDPSFGTPAGPLIRNTPGRMATIINYGDRAFGMLAFRSPLLTYDHQDLDAQRAILHDAFGSDGAWHVPDILDAIDRADDFYFDSVSQVRMPTWSRGRVVLLGDAAYCSSFFAGMGTSLALLGASHLATRLASAGPDPASALALYESAMRPHVAAAQDSVPANADFLVPETWTAIEARDALVRQDKPG